VLEQIEVGDQTQILRFERTGNFIPGNVLSLACSPTGPFRLYSIASGLHEPFYEILYTVEPEGALTPKLCSLQAGDCVFSSQAHGNFTDCTDAIGMVWWIANGTGIAPFASMAKSHATHNHTLLHGVQSIQKAWYQDIFGNCPGLHYIPCVSSGKDSRTNHELLEQCWFGRLSTWITEHGSARFKPADRFLLCGNAGMIVTVRELLIKQGIEHERITSEIYF